MFDQFPLSDLPDETMISIYKEKTPQQRLEISFGLWSFARSLVKAGLETLHPDWPEQAIEEETAKRMLNAAE
ncbi:MAG: hypothetical protein Q8O91_09070 [Candidatus Aminicenantes bacterium]|nr:hypothetical protein [Candidatus Aminicenantes bacterium]